MSKYKLTRNKAGYPIGGYRIDLEEKRELVASSTDVGHILQSKIKSPRVFDPRSLFKLDPTKDMRVEDQGQVGSCAGWGGSSAVELSNWIQTKRMTQFSANFLYISAQKEDGLSGDVGATINGCARVLEKYGIPDENVWPYPGRYDPRPPGSWDDVHRAAAKNKVGSHTVLNSAEDVVQYLRAGLGGVQIGISWGGDVDRNGQFQWKPGGGGHSVCFLGWNNEGEMLLWMLNSWGTKWGKGGWALVSMRTLEAMFRHPHTVMIGYSVMADPDITDIPVDFSKGTTVIPGRGGRK